MNTTRQFTAILSREEDAFVPLCPELEVVSQGMTVEEARTNLVEAIELFLEAASPDELRERLRGEVFITRVEVNVA